MVFLEYDIEKLDEDAAMEILCTCCLPALDRCYDSIVLSTSCFMSSNFEFWLCFERREQTRVSCLSTLHSISMPAKLKLLWRVVVAR